MVELHDNVKFGFFPMQSYDLVIVVESIFFSFFTGLFFFRFYRVDSGMFDLSNHHPKVCESPKSDDLC